MKILPIPISRHQQQFRTSRKWLRGFCGGRNSGKSKIGTVDVSQRARPGEPWMVISPDNNMIRDSTLPTFLETVRFTRQYISHCIAPTPRVKFRTRWGGVAEVIFKGAEVPDKLRGPSMAGIWFDEASIISKEAFDIAIACCRYQGKMGPVLATFTPRGFAHWTFESFYDGIDETLIGTDGCSADGIEWFQGKPFRSRPDTQLIRCSTRDNPFAPPEYYGRVGKNYSSAFALQELEGEFVEFSGMIFRREWFSKTVENAPVEATRVRFWDKAACLLGDTPITTDRGVVPIRSVRRGDRVLTRNGMKSVTKAWLSKRTDKLVSVVFSNGSVLTGTPNHLIFTQNRNWVELAALTNGDFVLLEGEQWQGQEIQNSNTLSLMEGRTRKRSVENTTRRGYGTKKTSDSLTTHCIERSTDHTTGAFPLAITFTIKTGTQITTTSRTLNACHPKNTSSITPTSTSPELLSQLKSIERKHLLAFASGSTKIGALANSRKCALLAQGRRGRMRLTGYASALNATANSNLALMPLRDSAVKGARQEIASESWGLRKSHASCGHAKTVELSSSGQGELRRVVTHVGRFCDVPVYDLSVSGSPEFFADGVLVHNSAHSGCYTVGLLMARDAKGLYYIEDVVRGQWSAHERDQIMLQTARSDFLRYGGEVLTYIEQEGGGDGKSVIDQLIVMLSEFPVYRWSTTAGASWKTKGNVRLPGDAKVRRARPFSAQCEAGNIRMVLGHSNGRFHRDFIEEVVAFPEFAYADQVDAASSAFNVLQQVAPSYTNHHSERSTEVVANSRYGHTANHSDGDSISRWSDLPWNQDNFEGQTEY